MSSKKVDLFGLDKFGDWSGMAPYWGVLAGGGVQVGTAALVRAFSDNLDKWSEGIGLLASGVVSGAMIAISPKTRGAGFLGLITAALQGVPRQIEAYVYYTKLEKAQKEWAEWKVKTENLEKYNAYKAAYGALPEATRNQLPAQTQLQGLGIPAVEQTQLAGLGRAQAQQVQLLGGMGAHYGATSIGGGRN